MSGIDLRVDFAEKQHFLAQNGKIEEFGFEGRAQVQNVFGELRKLRSGIIARMLNDAFAKFKRKIQPGKIKIALLELFDDAERVQIVIEAATVCAHQFVELAFAGMAERGMANVVDESKRLGELGVQPQCRGDGAGNLCDLQRMRQAIPEMVGIAGGENLRLGFQAAKGARMNDAVAVTRVDTAVRMGRLGIAPAAGGFRAHRPESRSGNWFDGPLLPIPSQPPQLLCAGWIRISAKEYPGRDRLDPQWWCPEIPS